MEVGNYAIDKGRTFEDLPPFQKLTSKNSDRLDYACLFLFCWLVRYKT